MKLFYAFISLFAISVGVQARLGEQLKRNDGAESETFHQPIKETAESVPPAKLSERDLEMDEVPVLVKYKTKEAEERTEAMSNSVGPKLKRVKTVATKVDKSKLKDLEDDPDIELVELDERMFLYNNVDIIPYGIRKVFEGKSSAATIPEFVDSAACTDLNAVKVGIIDSGIAAAHPDLPCGNINDSQSARCKGNTFYVEDVDWFKASNPHGSHVSTAD